jgi:hypothetical protein
MHGHLDDLDIPILPRDGRNRGIRALGKDHGALLLAVLLGQLGDVFCDFFYVFCGEGVGLCVGGGFGLVAEEDVDVGEGLI